MTTRQPCPTCGCRLYQESGPCAGEDLLAMLRQFVDRCVEAPQDSCGQEMVSVRAALIDAARAVIAVAEATK